MPVNPQIRLMLLDDVFQPARKSGVQRIVRILFRDRHRGWQVVRYNNGWSLEMHIQLAFEPCPTLVVDFNGGFRRKCPAAVFDR